MQVSIGINSTVQLQFRKFQQALEEEFGDDIEIVSFTLYDSRNYAVQHKTW